MTLGDSTVPSTTIFNAMLPPDAAHPISEPKTNVRPHQGKPMPSGGGEVARAEVEDETVLKADCFQNMWNTRELLSNNLNKENLVVAF